MYQIQSRHGVIRAPPERLGEDYELLISELARSTFEGKLDTEGKLVVMVSNIEPDGNGRVVHGDGGVFQSLNYDALLFQPLLQEVVDGYVVDVIKFGAFVRFGPFDGLLHISQIMDDKLDVDEGGKRIIGKETKRDIKVGDRVRARIISVSLNDKNVKESKIGLTMRQTGLGKFEWIEEDRSKKSRKEKGEIPA
ncbi:MAG: DNA-directed RNA polymerase [Candidatus Thermoplasmatota archaeon]|nr:DNA-directed RNA polymerase [Candidatus Sysuiplasma jiujiangense]MBX8639931.1 DNA-directed RNA polymerase [Candidatus Sysuiplasma jiujiangense]MBX8641158.1 DNA-directed RNA polymerase [Candidatus Sysuiplasma jiujiangense]MCL5253532.1 DNA-directed RNA polymerase [Candidatus Thermoplasmatota archaeon]MCL5678162.1 DNA-directed RNA polymerase [Candidatus Thermoplasmatota archaeon]